MDYDLDGHHYSQLRAATVYGSILVAFSLGCNISRRVDKIRPTPYPSGMMSNRSLYLSKPRNCLMLWSLNLKLKSVAHSCII